MGRAIGGMEFVRCTEVVRLSESPLLEVSLYYTTISCYPIKLLATTTTIRQLLTTTPNYLSMLYAYRYQFWHILDSVSEHRFF